METTLTVKRGTTIRFRRSSVQSESTNEVVPLAGFTITSTIRGSRGQLLAELTMLIDGDEFYSEGVDSANFPLGPAKCDVRFAKEGEVIYSPTVIFNLVEEQTR